MESKTSVYNRSQYIYLRIAYNDTEQIHDVPQIRVVTTFKTHVYVSCMFMCMYNTDGAFGALARKADTFIPIWS